MNYKKKLVLKGTVLLTIVVLFMTVSPSLVAGQGNTTPPTSQIDMSDESLNMLPKQVNTLDLQYAAKHVSNRYLNLFGYESSEIIQYDTTSKSGVENGRGTYSVMDNGKRSTVSITDTLEVQVGKTKNYRYEAQFTSDNAKAYSVEESYVETRKGNQVTSTFYQRITGSMNYCVSATEEKTISDIITKETNIDIRLSNTTGSYYIVADMMGTWNADESLILNATVTINQNIFSQSEISNGRYTYIFAPEFDKFGQKYNVTLPNGTIVDPWFEHPVSTGGGWGTHLDVYWFAWTEEEGRWETIGGIILNLFLRYVKAAWQISYFVFAILSIIALGTFYKSDMSGITILYYTVVSLWEILPIDMEFGYYTDRFNGDPLGDWYYMPLFNSLYFAPYEPHIGPWPCFGDPLVTVLGYDESASVSVDGIPLCINGTWAGYTGSTFLLPPGTYTLEVPNYEGNSFHYFDVDGVPVYDNLATITIGEEDITITVHYYYLPTYSVTVSALDTYVGEYVYSNVYIDGQYAGATGNAFTMKPGYHTIEVDSYGWSDYWQCYVGFLGWSEPYGVNTCATVLLNSDLWISAIYNYY
jgi:hypothetical protein